MIHQKVNKFMNTISIQLESLPPSSSNAVANLIIGHNHVNMIPSVILSTSVSTSVILTVDVTNEKTHEK